MSELPIQQGGLRVLSGIVPASSASTYGTHYSYLGVGGYVEVPNIDYRNSIPPDSNMNDEGYSTGRRRYGMMVYVIDEDKLYRLFPFSGGSVVSMETFTGTSELNQVTMLSNNNGWIEVPDLSVLITGGTYFSGNSSIVLYDSTGGTVSITGITTTDIINPGDGRVLVSTGNSENIFVAQSNMVFNGTNLNITGGTFITDSGGSLHSSAIIQFKSTTKGVLLPGMTTSQKNAIVNPTTGLTVYDSTIEDISVYTSSGWTGVIAERDNLQKVTERGNSTNSGLIISGTTYLVGSGSTTGNTFVTSNSANTQTFTIKDNGNILIGTTTDTGYKLDVNGRGHFTNGLVLEQSGYVGFINNGMYSSMGYNTSPEANNTVLKIGFGAGTSVTTLLKLDNSTNVTQPFGGSTVLLDLIANPSQTNNIIQWRNSSGVVLGVVNNLGHIGIGTTGSTEQRLFVSGSTLFRSTGTTSGSTAFSVQNSTGGTLLNLFSNGNLNVDNGALYVDGDNGRVGIGTSTLGTSTELTISSSQTASSSIARGQLLNTTLVASANNDVLVGLDINPTFTNGSFTGVTNWGIRNYSSFRFETASDLSHGLYWSIANDGTQLKIFGSSYSGGMGYLQLNVLSGSDGMVVNGSSRNLTIKAAGSELNITPSNTIFNQNGTGESMRIVSSTKNVLIGTTTDAGYKLDVVGADSMFNGVRVGLGAGGVSTNTVVGSGALNANTAGSSITAIGYQALKFTTGSNNTAIGKDAGLNNTTGSDNTYVGYLTGLGSATSIRNTYLGSYAGYTNSSGNDNVALGFNSLFANISGSNNTAVGQSALASNTASNNTAVGYQAGYSNTTVAGITAIGYQAGYSNTTALITAIGYFALKNNVDGSPNTAVGYGALASNVSNIANTAVGHNALGSNTAGSNTAVGHQSSTTNTTGSNNSSFGTNSLRFNTTGIQNTAIGSSALSNTTSSFNVGLGYIAGAANTTGDNNIFIGYQSTGVSATESDRTWIGNSSTTSTWLAGNVLIGTTTNAGYKLDVSGTTRVVSTGSTSGSTTLTLQNSTGRTTTEFRSDGVIGISSASTFTTQVTSVISASTTNSGIAIVPNGTGAFTLSIPDGTAVGGTARGTNAVDLQMSRTSASSVAAWNYDSILGGKSNYMSANADGYRVIGGGFNNQISVAGYSFIGGGSTNVISGGGSAYNSILGGLSNTASSSYSTVIGGSSNTASGQYSVAGGTNNNASGQGSITIGYGNSASGNYSLALGIYNSASAVGAVALGGSGSGGGAGTGGNTASGIGSFAVGQGSSSYLYGQNATAAYKFAANGDAQQSLLTSRAISAVTSGGTVTLSLDGSGTANLIIPNGNNRAWNVVVNTITVCTVVSGGTLTVGDAHAGEYKFLFKRVGGTSTISPITTSSEVADTSMATASFSFSAGTSQQMAITFNSPNTANNSTFRAVAKVALTEVAW